jgi:hypothetical protein
MKFKKPVVQLYILPLLFDVLSVFIMHVDGSYNGTSCSSVSQTVFLRIPFCGCRFLVGY